jgi:hypothetical protein
MSFIEFCLEEAMIERRGSPERQQEMANLLATMRERRTPEQKEEIAKLWAAHQARQRAMWREERGNNKLQISLIAASDDAPAFSAEYQAEMHRFIERVRATDIEIQTFSMAMDAVDAQGGIIGEFLIPLAQAIGGLGIGGVIGAWLNSRSGRRVELKFGDIEVKARTSGEIEEALKLVTNYRDQKPNVDKDKT